MILVKLHICVCVYNNDLYMCVCVHIHVFGTLPEI